MNHSLSYPWAQRDLPPKKRRLDTFDETNKSIPVVRSKRSVSRRRFSRPSSFQSTDALELPIPDEHTTVDNDRVRDRCEMRRNPRYCLQSSPVSTQATELPIQDKPAMVDNDCLPSSRRTKLRRFRDGREMHRNQGRSTLQRCPSSSDRQTSEAKEPTDNDMIAQISGSRKSSLRDDFARLVNFILGDPCTAERAKITKVHGLLLEFIDKAQVEIFGPLEPCGRDHLLRLVRRTVYDRGLTDRTKSIEICSTLVKFMGERQGEIATGGSSAGHLTIEKQSVSKEDNKIFEKRFKESSDGSKVARRDVKPRRLSSCTVSATL